MAWNHLTIIAVTIFNVNTAATVQFAHDGIVSIPGFAGVSYKAVSYVPVCGTLSLTDPNDYDTFTTDATCDASMSVYSKTAMTSAVYDYTGTPSEEIIGNGNPLCMCSSSRGAQGRMDICLNILGDGTPYTDNPYAAGTFVSNSRKALAQCSEVNVKAISSSVYASLAANEIMTPARPADPTADIASSTTRSTQTGNSGASASRISVTPSEAEQRIETTIPAYSTIYTASSTTGGRETSTDGVSVPQSTDETSAKTTDERATGESDKGNKIDLGVGLGVVSR